ncbi:hypothetical protein BE04_04115 [Sorangium cellulosum]|uniref:NADP-dependent oxidoreductase domain-containing protein n=2 Tax=Sorangium cellulosum TaxID=56 RepID=A0A150NZT4_SORCE|nr:aldo/keto reductase [Sorangium cellulosum]AGP37530.1 hypothetical protein SCE1572_25375 [Sorangium cellulosum So0157-2]KYF47823.1 hypothetical protein BE04_04115 [Sorangium cellulosum]
MRYNLLGKTGLYVSELCLGAMTFGGKGFYEVIGALGTSEAEALVGTSLDRGVNFIDTADVYSEGESERIVGAALKALGRPREQVVVRPFVTSVIIGAKPREQLDDSLAAADVTLSPEHIQQLDAASALPPEYPGWIVEWQNRDARGVAGGQPVMDRARQHLTRK